MRPAYLAGWAVLGALTVAALAAAPVSHLLGLDDTTMDLAATMAEPSAAHPLGTDDVGRDLLARLLVGAQVSLTVGLAAALLASLIGTVIGLVAGVIGGAVDAGLMRLTDGFVALPLLPLLIVLGALDPTKLGLPADAFKSEWGGLARTIVIIALVGWTVVARQVRGSALSLRNRDYVRAAEALGAGTGRIMLHHILPNLTAPLLVATALSIGNIVLLESGLSFLGLGVQPPLPSWGNMLSSALEQMGSAPRLALWPGLLIALAVLGFNLVADGLQDALDPKGGRR